MSKATVINQFKNEVENLIKFLRKHLLSLHKAVLSNHNLGWKRILIWSLLLIVPKAIVQNFGHMLPVGGAEGVLLQLYSAFWGTPISIIKTLVLWGLPCAVLGLIIKYTKGELEWKQWLEFCFICALPMLVFSLGYSLLPFKLIMAINFLFIALSLAVSIYALWIFYLGLKLKFKICQKNPERLKYAFLVAGALIVLSNLYGYRAAQSLTELSNYGISNAYISPKDVWTPEIPIKQKKEVADLYAKNSTEEKAALQYAHTFWTYLGSNDKTYRERRNQLSRALDCMRLRKISEDMDVIDAILMFHISLTKRYLALDQRSAGHTYSVKYFDEPCN